MKRFTRDDTEHGKEYYLASEVDAAFAAQPVRQLIWLSKEDEQEIKNYCTTVACVLKAAKVKLKDKNT